MDPPFSGFVLDPSECRKLSVDEKRDIIRELSRWPESAPQKLQAWSRKDLLEILCAEIGKERKYTGWTKQKLIENLFKVVSEKKSGENVEAEDSTPDLSTANIQSPSKRPRKSEHPLRLPVATKDIHPCDEKQAVSNIKYCQNVACRALLKLEDTFCKRCSCFICHKYDDNKDPSLWLFCGPDALAQGDSCGMSCHLECALKHEGAGIGKKGKSPNLDGCYYCINCGKVNDLLRSWKKQLMVAKDARRVDVLCHRISLSHKLLSSTKKYQRLHEIVDVAMKKLEAEVGPITGSTNISRGIVNRLSVGSEVQKLCASSIDLLETITSSSSSASLLIQESNNNSTAYADLSKSHERYLDCCGKSEILGSQKASELSDHADDNINRQKSGEEVIEPDQTTPGHFGSAIDSEEPNSKVQTEYDKDFVHSMENNLGLHVPKSENESNTCNLDERVIVPFLCSDHTLPATPCRVETTKEGTGKSNKAKTVIKITENGLPKPDRDPGSLSKKRCVAKYEEVCVQDGSSEAAYEYCVKAIRRLECQGHIETNFRVKFLTWFSLRATPQERKIVSVYVDTLMEDPASLAGQLVDTFSETICSKRPPLMPNGFCMKLLHRGGS